MKIDNSRADVVGSIRTLEHTRCHPECGDCPKAFDRPPECKILAYAAQQSTEKPVDFDAPPVLEEHYDVKVWTDPAMDALRRERCLCLRCGRPKKTPGCRSAHDLLEMCRATNIALMVTRCPRFVRKGG